MTNYRNKKYNLDEMYDNLDEVVVPLLVDYRLQAADISGRIRRGTREVERNIRYPTLREMLEKNIRLYGTPEPKSWHRWFYPRREVIDPIVVMSRC